MQPIYKSSFRLYKTNDARTLIENPISVDGDGDEPKSMLVITNQGISVGDRKQVYPTSKSAIVSTQEIIGVIGIIELSYGKYLLAITSRKLSATLQSHKIWNITGGLSIPIGAAAPISMDALPDHDLAKYAIDMELLKSINNIILSGRLYYSTSYDVTHSLQHNYLVKNGLNIDTVVDDRYFFNHFLQTDIIDANQSGTDTTPWVTKVIAGFVGMIEIDYESMDISNRVYQALLISRVNHRRLGTRYVRRGLDNEGNAANNVEMEQIVVNYDYLKSKLVSSFCQSRGSAPSIWGQDLDLSYRPRLVLADANKESVWSSIKSHYDDLKHQYIGEKTVIGGVDNGHNVCVNLLDDTGFEGPLSDIYENSVRKLNDSKIKYESFPMNKWCKKMNYSNMDILIDRVRIPLINSGWFIADGDVPSYYSTGTLQCTKLQTGITRISCLDSLDRTNLTCSLFARYLIPSQVQSISPNLPSEPAKPVTGISPAEVHDPVAGTRKAITRSLSSLTCLWADSGDAISLLYAGTGALKADVTRTGKRQMIKGSYADGMNSLARYYLNNVLLTYKFTHGHLQDSYDVFTGKIKIADIKNFVDSQGTKKALRMKFPLLQRSSFPGNFIPAVVIDVIEPVFFNAREFMATKNLVKNGDEDDGANALVTTLKEIAPVQVTNILELFWAMFLFFWIVIVSRILKVQGRLIVDRPRFTKEDSKLKELVE